MELFEAIRTRRSIRNYTGEPMPAEDLMAIVETARLAPSGSNMQPWEFIIVTDREAIDTLKNRGWVDGQCQRNNLHCAGYFLALVVGRRRCGCHHHAACHHSYGLRRLLGGRQCTATGGPLQEDARRTRR